jgi:hypothetical protein
LKNQEKNKQAHIFMVQVIPDQSGNAGDTTELPLELQAENAPQALANQS